MSDTPLAKKLLIKPENTVLLLNVPKDFALDLPEGAQRVSKGPADVVVAFAHNRAEADTLAPQGAAALNAGGKLWLCYPKKTGAIRTDLHRDILHAQMKEKGFDGVTLVSADDTWSAMRFHPPGTK